MKSPANDALIVLSLAGLAISELRRFGLTPQHLRRLFYLTPLRERNALRLFYDRGATYGELAGLLGVSPRTVGRLLERARHRLRDPLNLILVAGWARLDPAERRIVDLHRCKGHSLNQVARMGLVCLSEGHNLSERPARLGELKAAWRRIERKGRRWLKRRQRDEPGGGDADGPEGAASSSSNG